MEKFEVYVSNNLFIDNLVQTISKAWGTNTKCTPIKPEEVKDTENIENNQQDQQQTSLTGNILDELIRNVIGDAAVGELELLLVFLKGSFSLDRL